MIMIRFMTGWNPLDKEYEDKVMEVNKLLELERKACITKTIEWFFIQLNDGDMECGDIEKFVDNYRKYMEE